MFTDFKLVPGGAFIMCEDVSEFDANAPTPPIPDEVQSAIVQECHDCDPVMKLVNKMRDPYEKYVKPLLNMNYQPGDLESTLATTERIRISASGMSDHLVRIVAKTNGMREVRNAALGKRYCGDKFHANAGWFLKNVKRIQQLGLSEYTYDYEVLPCFRSEYQLNLIYNIARAKTSILDDYISGDMLSAMSSPELDLGQVFDSANDILQVIFEDPERFSRMEKNMTGSVNIQLLLNSLYQTPVRKIRVNDDVSGPIAIRLIAQVVRTTLQEVYRIQCEAVDNPKIAPDLSRLMIRLTNLFAVIAIYVLHLGYELREDVAWAKAVDRYTDELLDKLKND